MKPNLTTFGEAAEELGCTYHTIRTLVRNHGIDPKPVPRNGAGKGLDPADMRKLRKLLNVPLPKRRPSQAQAQ